MTLRHLAVAATVVVVVNAQLTWWVVYVLRENRTRLDLERQATLDICHHECDRIENALDDARAALLLWLADGAGESPLPAPFVSWSERRGPRPGWSDDGEALQLTTVVGSALTDEKFRRSLLELREDLKIVELGPEDSLDPHVAMPEPFSGLQIAPTSSTWNEILEGYRSRIKMVVAEASFFALLLFVVIGFLWKTLRREVELERQHRNFLSAITHELKSPLAAMRLSLETVLRGRADSTASVRFLENALQDTERLQSLVQKVLEVTRYGQSGGQLELQRSCLREVIEDTLATFNRRATSAGAQVTSELDADIWVKLDEEAFAIVLSNLLENAIKYGGTIPSISVKISLDNDQAHIDIGDNGKGINEDEVPFIFNRFFRGGDEMTRTTQGTGLGLYLVRQIMSAHHGTVEVHTTGRQGTTFRLTLPDAEVWEDRV